MRLRRQIVFVVKHKADIVQMQTHTFGILRGEQRISCPVLLKDNFQELAHYDSRYFLAVKLLGVVPLNGISRSLLAIACGAR